MVDLVSANVRACLQCPQCGSVLRETPDGLDCTGCALAYPRLPRGAVDLRLRQPRSYDLTFQLGSPFPSRGSPAIEPLKMNPSAEVNFTGVDVPYHMTAELRSHVPKARAGNSLMLDLGCGNAVHKGLCELAGFEWVGADYDDASEASILADAHALPFKDASFECVLTIASLQLFQNPFVAMQEAQRVLKPGGVLLGTVAFLEPAAGGFYHHTHRGVLNSLESAGFTVDVLAPSKEWSMLVAQAQIGLFPKMPAFLSRAIVLPLEVLHKLWWAAGRRVTGNPNAADSVRVMNTTAAFAFVARRAA